MGRHRARASLGVASSGALALAVAIGTSGCMVPTHIAKVDMDIPRDVTPVIVEAGLRAIDDPANKQRMQQLLASPEIKAMEREIVAGLLDGSLAALGDDDRAGRIGALTSRYAAGMLQDLSRDVGPQMGALLSEGMRGAVRAAVSEALRPEHQRELSTAVSEAMTRDLGPAVQKVLADNLAPGLAAALQNDEVERALGQTARLLGREVVLGVQEGLTQIQADKPEGKPSSLESLGELLSGGAKVASGLTWVLGALVMVLAALLVRLLMQARKYRSEIDENVAKTRLITEATKASEEGQGRAGPAPTRKATPPGTPHASAPGA